LPPLLLPRTATVEGEHPSPVPAEIRGCYLWSRSMTLGSAKSEDPMY